MTATPHIPDDLFARAQTIVGLRQLADYLEANPDVPVKEFGADYSVYITADPDNADPDVAGRAEVERIARILDVAPVDETCNGGHYWACKTFGRISYRAVHIPSRAWARHHAQDSYRHNISIGLDHDGQHAGQQDEAA